MANTIIPSPYVITPDDKRGLIVLTVALVVSFVWTCWFIRLWLRIKKREWKTDDIFLFSATVSDRPSTHTTHFGSNGVEQVLVTIQSGIVLHLVNLGLGTTLKGLELQELVRIGKVGTSPSRST